VQIKPTLFTAALAGVFSGIVMPMLWVRLSDESTGLVLAFLGFVVFPVHAFVVGMGRDQAGNPRSVDTALLKRVGAWLLCAVAATAISQALRA
jgi:Na+/H+-dicarboxylate symporter